MELTIAKEKWPLVHPFSISGYVFEAIDVLVVGIADRGFIGRGEAAAVYYRGETVERMAIEVEAVRCLVEDGLDRARLQALMRPGGARNALDCALWDLEAKISGKPVWQLAGLGAPRPLVTTFTCGADTPDVMATTALSYAQARAIKLKLTGEASDCDRVRAVREARPDVWLAVDANQGFDYGSLESLMPTLVDCGVALIEQPFPVGMEALLDDLASPIRIAADESAQVLDDIPSLVGRFDVVNVKLDKCGGLTEGLAMARAVQAAGLEPMVGNMLGTSLAMAPAFLVGQLCEIIDLDGPVFLTSDRENRIRYEAGYVDCPAGVWGAASGAAYVSSEYGTSNA